MTKHCVPSLSSLKVCVTSHLCHLLTTPAVHPLFLWLHSTLRCVRSVVQSHYVPVV